MNDQSSTPQPAGRSAEGRRRLRLNWRSLGVAGFLFFLIKGLLWLSIPLAIAAWRMLSS